MVFCGRTPRVAKKVGVDLEERRWAFEDQQGECSWVLDTETGLVLRLSEEEEDELPLSIEEIEEDSTGRFLAIEPEDPQEGYGDMQAFIGTVAEPQFRELLEVAIADKGEIGRAHV